MSGRRSRDKGARTERAIVKALQAQGIVAAKISGMYRPGADISMTLLGTDRVVEVKCRAAGFRELYTWLDGRDVLIVKADRQEPLVVLRMSLAAEIAGTGAQSSNPNGGAARRTVPPGSGNLKSPALSARRNKRVRPKSSSR
jgi:hypothetical protein